MVRKPAKFFQRMSPHTKSAKKVLVLKDDLKTTLLSAIFNFAFAKERRLRICS